jgi:hypothetical protein
MTRLLAWLVVGAVLGADALAPGMAAACATCISSAYGDRGFNWAYLLLLIMPFVVLCVVGGILAWSAGYRPSQLRTPVRSITIEERT